MSKLKNRSDLMLINNEKNNLLKNNHNQIELLLD